MTIRKQLNDMLDSVDNQLAEAQRMEPRAMRPMVGCGTKNAHVHLVNWWRKGGGNGHPDLGWSSGDQIVMDWQADQILAMGGAGVNCLYSGRLHVNATAALKWKDYAKRRGLEFSVMWDKQGECSVEDVEWLMENLVGPDTFLCVFDDPTPDQIEAIAGYNHFTGMLYRNSNGLSKPHSLGCFGWPSFGKEKEYREYFAKQVVSTGKIVVPHISPGGGGAPWNKPGMITDWRNGDEWRESIAWADALAMRCVNSPCKLVASGDDFQENTAVLAKYLL